MNDIYTVILLNDASGELSTVSFFDFDKAKEYVVEEVLEHDDGSTSIDDVLDVLDALEREMFYDDGITKYYIEGAKLV